MYNNFYKNELNNLANELRTLITTNENSSITELDI